MDKIALAEGNCWYETILSLMAKNNMITMSIEKLSPNFENVYDMIFSENKAKLEEFKVKHMNSVNHIPN